jgi:hypothetical protein
MRKISKTTMKPKRNDENARSGGHDTSVTAEVGGEGGAPGDVEHGSAPDAGTGSEATETWQPERPRDTTIRRDETGRGRRSP